MNRLLKKIQKNKAVSFDVFDTLVERKVTLPQDIFQLVGENILGKEKASSFVSDRMEAERSAREKSATGEVTIYDIYAVLKGKYSTSADSLQEEEIRLELDNCIPKTSMVEPYRSAVDNGKSVYIISDMYLPSEVIGQILKKNGFAGYKKLFVSNEYGCDKRSGKLFTKVLSELGISNKDLLHIGDSIGADYLGAKKAGVKAVLIRRKNRLKRMLAR